MRFGQIHDVDVVAYAGAVWRVVIVAKDGDFFTLAQRYLHATAYRSQYKELKDWMAAYVAKVREVEAGMKAIHPDAGIDLDAIYDVPGLKPEVEGAAEGLARRLTGDNGTHVVSYGTEAGQFQAEGYSAVVCGPGDIAQAHQPNEYITIQQFEAGWAFMEKLVDHLTRE